MKNSQNGSQRVALIAAATAAVAVLTVAVPQAQAQAIPPLVPGNLQVEPGNTVFRMSHAIGTQNYVCLVAGGGFAWTFFGPQATLFDDSGQQVITHFLSANPDENGKARATWQDSQDTSSVWAAATASSTDSSFVAAGAIPWLLLQVVGTDNGTALGGTLSETTFVQRVNTQGGLAPATGCGQAADIGRKALVPYAADYVFYKD